MIKYSIALPVLNGLVTLKDTIPYILSSSRDDFELVISDNLSTDGSTEFLSSIDDKRVRLVKPKYRLSAGENLEFAYQNTRGEWLSHVGHDDVLLKSRFTVLDHAMSVNRDIEVINSSAIRCLWPNYSKLTKQTPITNLGKSNSAINLTIGVHYAQRQINEKNVNGGGSWCVKRNVYQKIIKKYGFYSHPQNLEFFAKRAACYHSKYVAETSFPTFLLGRHESSSGSQALEKKLKNVAKTWDWKDEDPNPFNHSPIQYKGYVPISLDGALRLASLSEDPDLVIDWDYWMNEAIKDCRNLIALKKIHSDHLTEVMETALQKNINPGFYYWHRLYIILKKLGLQKPKRADFKKSWDDNFYWEPSNILNKDCSHMNILEIASTVDENLPKYL